MEQQQDQKPALRDGERIAKVMARAGLCSRRDAEQWIEAGRVSVNGQTLTSPAFNVAPGDEVRVDGEPLAERQRTRLFAFHKPRGLVTTARDPEGRKTVFEALPPELPRVVTIGRLDINTEGLLLLTNDGGLARTLELPETGWLRRYRVRAHGRIEQAALDALKNGLTLEGVNYAGIDARLERTVGSNVWLTMGLREGKNREIKRVLDHLGLQVNRLIRISFGPFELGDIPEGAVIEIPTRVLRDQLGARLAKKADADFDAPILEAPRPAPEPQIERPRRRDDEFNREPRGGGRRDDAASRFRPRGGASAKRAPPVGTPPPKKRKHISVLRAEARAEAEERRRVARSATQDRKGRQVKVERISTARPPAAEARSPALDNPPKRPFREARDARPEGGERKPRSGAPGRSFGSERPDAAGAGPAKRPYREAGGSRPQGGERKPRSGAPGRSFGSERPASAGGRPEKRPYREAGGPRPEGGERRPYDRGSRPFSPGRPPSKGGAPRSGPRPPRKRP